MLNLMRNVVRIIVKRKSYILTSIILPIALIFIFTSLYSSNSTYKVALINNDNGPLGKVIEERISSMDGVTIVEEKDINKLDEMLVFDQITMAIVIDENFSDKLIRGDEVNLTVKSLSQDEFPIRVKEILKGEVSYLALICNNVNVNEVGVEKVIESYNSGKVDINLVKEEQPKGNINQSLGMILYLIIMSAGVCAGYLLEDENQGTKARALMGKVTEKSYYGAMGIIFFALSSVPAIEYYIICKLMKYEFGFNHTIVFLGMLLLAVLLGVSVNVMLTSIIKNKSVVILINSVGNCLLFMLSGAFWEFDMMNETLRAIGSALPIRWILLTVQNLQKGEGLTTVVPTLIGLTSLILVFFGLAIFFTRNKIVLVKEK